MVSVLCCVLVPCTLSLTLALSRRQAPELRQPGTPSKNRRRLGWHLPLWLDPAFLLGCSTSLEALKSLLSTTGHWHDFAHLELQSAWGHFTSINTYPQAVGLLARY